MKKNLSSIERVVRVVIALVVAILYLTNQITGVATIVLGVIAGAFILTSSAGFCPIYASLSLIGKKSESKP